MQWVSTPGARALGLSGHRSMHVKQAHSKAGAAFPLPPKGPLRALTHCSSPAWKVRFGTCPVDEKGIQIKATEGMLAVFCQGGGRGKPKYGLR